MRSAARPSVARQRGLSLIEILVGMAIGVIGILAMFQTVTVWTRHTQTTSAGSDAQTSGTLALFALERDLKQAGHGFAKATMPIMGCAVQASGPIAGRGFSFPLTPVLITAGAGGDPDEISILYGNSSFYVDAAAMTGSPTATSKTLDRRNGFKRGDLAVIAGNASASAASATCTLVEITNDTNGDGHTVDHVAGAYSNFYAAASSVSRYNDAGGTGTTYTAGTMFDLGPRPVRNTWKIVGNHSLARSELIEDTGDVEVADSVVNIKAQYGVDGDGDRQISAAEWSASAPADWTNVLAIRVGVLVRSRHFERNPDSSSTTPAPITASAPSWSGGTFAMRNIDGSTGATTPDNDWRYYRYRVYERVIPFLNRLWN